MQRSPIIWSQSLEKHCPPDRLPLEFTGFTAGCWKSAGGLLRLQACSHNNVLRY